MEFLIIHTMEKTVYFPMIRWSERQRTDLISFKNLDLTELDEGLVIGATVQTILDTRIRNIIIKYWGYFYARGVCQIIFYYTFTIDTGGASLVCCRKPSYGPHEKPIIMK